ncbi:MAG: N-acetylmuramoyl-L-alanine amidase [Actinomycetes bacterium]
MRRLPSAALLSLAVPALLALPVTTPSAPSPRPVPPKLATLAEAGVDRRALEQAGALDAAMAPEGGDAAAGPSPSGAAALVVLGPQRRTQGFRSLGVTWDETGADDAVEVAVRTRTGGSWTAWTALPPLDAAPDDGTAEAQAARRAGTEPLWAGPSDGVQLRVHAPSGRSPRDVQVHLVEPGTSPADSGPLVPRDVATADTPQPAVVSRAGWGADESLRTSAPSYSTTVKAAYLHHTATSNAYSSNDAAAQVRSIYAYHTKALGWSDIGYNFLVDRFGQIYEGRYGGIRKPVLGAHAGGFNRYTVGVAMIGTFSTVQPPAATLTAVQRLVAWKLSMYARDPLGTTTLVSAGGSTSRYPAGTSVQVPVVAGHRDTNATACPGDLGYGRLPEIRRAAADIIAQQNVSPIDSKHQYLGGDTGLLGPAVNVERSISDGRYRAYRSGDIYWSKDSGAYEVHGEILGRYRAAGAAAGPLGFPLTDETVVRTGAASTFEHGVISWVPGRGARVVQGAISSRWSGLGREDGPLGAPVTEEASTADGAGRWSGFDGGSVLWASSRGARAVQGSIHSRWRQHGGEGGVLGWPSTDELPTPDRRGRYNHFDRGSVYWSAGTGARAVRGSIREAWARWRWEAGPLGYPVTDELPTPNGVGQYNHFERGSVYWSPVTPASVVLGSIRHRWAQLRWEAGPLGFPTTDELRTPDGVGRYNHFQRGSVYWSPTTGAWEVQRPLRDAWARVGWEQGVLGYPVTGQRTTPDGVGRYNHFQRGSVYWSPLTGAHEVHGGIRSRWAELGWETGRLGYPVSDEYAVPGGRRSDFQGGSITWDSTTRATTVRWAW